jgi:hypothetical protein
MNTIKIYIATHQLFVPPINKIHVPITSGAYYHSTPYLKDNTLENISIKNPYYCELTALYWIWKHDNSDIIGLEHYHRFFQKKELITEQEIQNILKNNQIILPKAITLNKSVYKQYQEVHFGIDLQLACQKIIDTNPEYQNAIETVLTQNKLFAGNMFITNQKTLHQYLDFLFPLLFTLEKEIPFLEYSNYNQRIFGFLAERIFNIYLYHHQLSFYEYPIKDKLPKIILLKKQREQLKQIKRDNQHPRKQLTLKNK